MTTGLAFLLSGLFIILFLLWAVVSQLRAILALLAEIKSRLWDFGVRNREVDKPDTNRDVAELLSIIRGDLARIRKTLERLAGPENQR